MNGFRQPRSKDLLFPQRGNTYASLMRCTLFEVMSPKKLMRFSIEQFLIESSLKSSLLSAIRGINLTEPAETRF